MGTGYPDNERVINYDSPLLLSENEQQYEVLTQLLLVNCSRYAYLGGSLQMKLKAMQLVLQWWSDKAKTLLIGERKIVLSSGITSPVQLRIPNLGPWLSVSVKPMGIKGFARPNARVFLTNRVHPLELIPQQTTLLVISREYPAAEELNSPEVLYYTGPARLMVNNTGASALEWFLEQMNVAEAFEVIDTGKLAAGERKAFSVLLPEGAWRLKTKSAGITTAAIAVVASTTGSL